MALTTDIDAHIAERARNLQQGDVIRLTGTTADGIYRITHLDPTHSDYGRTVTLAPALFDDLHASEETREKLCDFIRAHGHNPDEIPADPNFEFEDGKVSFDRILRDENGKLFDEAHNVRTERVTVDQIAPWPL